MLDFLGLCQIVVWYSAYHMLSPALSVEDAGLMTYLLSPPHAGSSVVQVTSGLQSWKCAGRRLPTATQLHQSFVKVLSKHLAANKKVSFVFQQKSSTMPMMNPSPSEIVDLFSFVEVTLTHQGKTKGQQLKGKIVSEFTLFRTFSHFFRIFPPGLSP